MDLGWPAGRVLVGVQSLREPCAWLGPTCTQQQQRHHPPGKPWEERQINHKGREGKGDRKIKTALEVLTGKHNYLEMLQSQQGSMSSDVW